MKTAIKTRQSFTILSAMTVILTLTLLTFAQSFTQTAKLTANDGAASDTFGASVGISGETAIVGSQNADINNVSQGAAYIYVKNGNSWTQQTKLFATDGANNDFFGQGVAIDGDTTVVGAYQHEGNGVLDQGAVYIYVRNGTAWTLQQKLVSPDGGMRDYFGNSVAIEGNTLAISAPQHQVGANQRQGAIYVFTRTGTVWSFQQKLTASDGATGDGLNSVDLSGNTIIAGAESAAIGANQFQGAAYVFVRNGATWTEQQKLFAADGQGSETFGKDVSISGETVVVGVDRAVVGQNFNQGAAYVFTRNGVTWTFQQKLIAPDGTGNDQFGRSVSIDGETVIAGAWTDDVNNVGNVGSAYIFRRNGATWSSGEQLLADDGMQEDQFGFDVFLSGSNAIIGARFDDINTVQNQGSAYIFSGGSSPTVTRPIFDFDGDGKTDISVFRPSNGVWYINGSTSGFYGLQFGLENDQVTPADFDGDGKTDIAVFRPSNGAWYRMNSSNNTFVGIIFGQNGDLPRPADFDGDGKADINVFRPSNGAWYRLNSSNGAFFGTIFGQNGDQPLIADFDGDNKSDITVFRPGAGTFYRLESTTGAFKANAFGFGTDIPTLGDFDGDGKADIAVFRPSNGAWYRLNSSNGAFVGTIFGQNGDVPVSGDYDGDGKSDVAVFRPANGAWYRLNSSNGGFVGQIFGASTDKPIPAAFQ